MYNICDTFTLSFCSGDTTTQSVCVALEVHVAVSYMKVLNVTQECVYGKLTAPVIMQLTRASF